MKLLFLVLICVNVLHAEYQYIFDKEKQCSVYDDIDKESSNVELFWSGECKDKKAQGYGIAILSKEVNGTRAPFFRYEGKIVDGKYEGEAFVKWYLSNAKGSVHFKSSLLDGEAFLLVNDGAAFLHDQYKKGKALKNLRVIKTEKEAGGYLAFRKIRKPAFKYETLLQKKLLKPCEYDEHRLKARKYDKHRLSAPAFRTLIRCYAEQKRYSKAISTYEEALQYPKADSKLFKKSLNESLALAYYGIGKYDKSMAFISRLDTDKISSQIVDILKSAPMQKYSKGKKLLAKLEKDANIKMLKAIRNSNLEALKEALKRGANIHAKDKKGKTPLHIASYYKDVEIIQLLIKAGADIDAQSNDGSTALMNASYRGYVDIVKFLLEKGANIDLETKKGSTALKFAIQENKLKIVSELLSKVDTLTKTDALNRASCTGDIALMKILLKNGAVNSKRQQTNIFEKNPFTKAMLCEKEDSLKILIDDFSKKENTVNMLAAKLAYKNKYMEAIKIIEKEAQSNSKYLSSLVIPLSLEKYFIDGRIVGKDVPFLATKFELPKPISVNSVLINAPDGTQGSGLYIANDLILTNYHVAVDSQNKKHKTISILDRYSFDNKYIKPKLSDYRKAKIIALNKQYDLALLKLLKPNKNAPIISIDSGNRFENTTLYAAGFPSFSFNKRGYIPTQTISKGLHYYSDLTDPSVTNDYARLYASIPTQHGASGGPIINSCNQLVSVIKGGAASAFGSDTTSLIENPVMQAVSHVNLIRFLKKNNISIKRTKPCLPFGVPNLDSIGSLVWAIRFYNADQVSGLLISESEALFIAPKNIKIGDTILVADNDVSDKVGKVIHIDKKTRLALFKITEKYDKKNFHTKNFLTMSFWLRNNYKGFNKVIFSEDKFIKNRPSYYATTVYGTSIKNERLLIKGGGYYKHKGKTFKQRENYSKSDVFSTTGRTSNWLNRIKDKLYVEPKIDPSSTGAVILDECGYIEGMVQYDFAQGNSIIDSREMISVLRKWKIPIKVNQCIRPN